MTEVKLYKSPLKGLKVIALAMPFVVGGIWMITKADSSTIDRFMGWLGILFCGLGISVGLFHLFDRRPQIIINENGIWDRTTNEDEIKWEQILEAYLLTISGQKLISLVVDDTFVYKHRQYKWAAWINEGIGAQKLNLHFGQLKMDVMIMIDFIQEMAASDKDIRKVIISKYFDKETSNAQNFHISTSIM